MDRFKIGLVTENANKLVCDVCCIWNRVALQPGSPELDLIGIVSFSALLSWVLPSRDLSVTKNVGSQSFDLCLYVTTIESRRVSE